MNVFFTRQTAVKDMANVPGYLAVAPARFSLFPAVSASLIDKMLSRRGLDEQSASYLLKQYSNHYSLETGSRGRLTALEQWQNLIRPTGAAARIAFEMVPVLQRIACQQILSNPLKYCQGFESFVSLEQENIDIQMERDLYPALIAALADNLSMHCKLSIVEGRKTIPAILHFHKEAEITFNIRLDRATWQFEALLHHPDRFQNMKRLAKAVDGLSLDLNLFLHSVISRYQENIARYTMMIETCEINDADLLKRYTKSLDFNEKNRWVCNPNSALNSSLGTPSSPAYPELTLVLMQALSWSEAITQEKSPNRTPSAVI